MGCHRVLDAKNARLFTRLLVSICLAVVALFTFSRVPAQAQIASFTKTDFNATAGSYSYSSGTYTVTGYGTGIGGSADSFTFASTPVTGNVEMIAKINGQTNTSNYAQAGLMMRDSLNSNGQSANACITVSPANGVNFTVRATDNTTSTTTLGPTIPPVSTTPVYLRLVLTGPSVSMMDETL